MSCAHLSSSSDLPSGLLLQSTEDFSFCLPLINSILFPTFTFVRLEILFQAQGGVILLDENGDEVEHDESGRYPHLDPSTKYILADEQQLNAFEEEVFTSLKKTHSFLLIQSLWLPKSEGRDRKVNLWKLLRDVEVCIQGRCCWKGSWQWGQHDWRSLRRSMNPSIPICMPSMRWDLFRGFSLSLSRSLHTSRVDLFFWNEWMHSSLLFWTTKRTS